MKSSLVLPRAAFGVYGAFALVALVLGLSAQAFGSPLLIRAAFFLAILAPIPFIVMILARGGLGKRSVARGSADGVDSKIMQRLIVAERRIGTWKQALFTSKMREEELAGEIINVIMHASRISSDTAQVHDRMANFDDNFHRTFENLKTIEGSVSDLDSSIVNTANATEQTSAAVEEISASIQRISEISTQRAQEIRGLAQTAVSGQSEMSAAQNSIEKINKGIDDLTGFIGIIDDIAGRTSILSMNAAIQAAHAGEAGKGFAVVAEEIRRLAESTAQNAASINRRLAELIQGIKQAEKASRTSSERFALVEREARESADSFLEIEHGMKELAIGSREILQAVTNLRETSNNLRVNSSSVSQASTSILDSVDTLVSSSVDLSGSVHRIQDLTAELNLAGLTLAQSDAVLLKDSGKLAAENDGGEGISASLLRLQHVSWVSRVRASIDGKLSLDLKSLGNHKTCDLGKWLIKDGERVLGPAGFADLDAIHQRLHLLVGEIAQLVGEGKVDEAETRFKDLDSVSREVVSCIDKNLEGRLGDSEAIIRWIPEFSVGNKDIDAQHLKLVGLINELGTALRSGKGNEVLKRVLAELVNYAATHFSLEEKYFMPTDYPHKEEHLKIHRTFTDQALQLQKNFENGTVVLGSETLAFLRSWLSDHILGMDKGYAQHL